MMTSRTDAGSRLVFESIEALRSSPEINGPGVETRKATTTARFLGPMAVKSCARLLGLQQRRGGMLTSLLGVVTKSQS